MVHTRARESKTLVEKWINFTTELLDSDPLVFIHWSGCLRPADETSMLVETAVQVKAGLVWTFLMHGTRTQKVPPTDTTLISSTLVPVTWLVLWREHVVQVVEILLTIESCYILYSWLKLECKTITETLLMSFECLFLSIQPKFNATHLSSIK